MTGVHSSVEDICSYISGPQRGSTTILRPPTQYSRPKRPLQWTLVNQPEMRPSLVGSILSLQHRFSTSVASSKALVNVDRLLIRRTVVSADRVQPFASSSAFLQLIRVLFRGMLETVREVLFSKCGSQQFQIDVSWLHDTLFEYFIHNRRLTSFEDPRHLLHPFGYQVGQPQSSRDDEHQFRFVSILVEEMILSSAASAASLSTENDVGDEVSALLGCLLPLDELDKILSNEVPIE